MTEEEKREEADADALFVLEAGTLVHKLDPTRSSGEGYELENGNRRFQKPSIQREGCSIRLLEFSLRPLFPA